MDFKNLRKRIDKLVDPREYRCLGCNMEVFGTEFCPYCEKLVQLNDGYVCPICGRRTNRPEICIECKAKLPSFARAVSPLEYEGVTPKLIKRFKHGRKSLAGYFAPKMVKAAAELPRPDAMVFVPMTRRDERRRGYNQSRLLAEAMSELSGVPVLYGALEKTEQTEQQKRLERLERIKNLEGCFKADGKLVKDKVLLLVDDVTTTGATLDCACTALKQAKAKAVYAVTAASVTFVPKEDSRSADRTPAQRPR